MGLFKKRAAAEPDVEPEPQEESAPRPVLVDDDRLPGSAGYSGRAGRNAMPNQRFKFVRPDEQRQQK